MTIPTSEVGGVKLTWVSGNTLLVKWDRVTTDDIIGYKISWVAGDVMSGKVINTLSSFHTFVDDRFLTSGNVTVLMWTYNSAGDGPISMTSKLFVYHLKGDLCIFKNNSVPIIFLNKNNCISRSLYYMYTGTC